MVDDDEPREDLDGPAYVDATPVPPGVSAEPWSEAAAAWRLDRVRPHLPVAVPSTARFVGGQSNDAWFVGEDVLRVCWRSDRHRLLREARILAELPEEVPHASVSAAGLDAGMSWVLSPRLPGRPLLEVGQIGAARLRDVFRQLAEILRVLHSWRPSTELRAHLVERPDLDVDRPLSVWAADLVPLPFSRLEVVAGLARTVPFVDGALVDSAVARISSLARHDPFPVPPDDPDASVVHGDATPANILVDDEGHVTGLIDLEHARWAPKDLELLSPVTFARAFGLDWLREDYPELFSGAYLRERVWLYELCCAVRNVIWWPPESPQQGDATDHPSVLRLRELVEAPSPW